MSAYRFSWEPIFAGLPLLAAAGYVWAARTERPSRVRVIAFAAGAVLVAASLNSPLETIAAHYLLLAHLLQNALIADLAPPLLILGLAAGLLFWSPLLGGRISTPGALAYLAVAFVGSSFLGLALIFSTRPLYVLRAHARPAGALADARPEPRRDPDERGADARLPRRDRLLPVAPPRRGACDGLVGERFARGRLNAHRCTVRRADAGALQES